MKKAKKKSDSKQQPENNVGSLLGAEYCINFRVSIPFDVNDGAAKEGEISMVTNYVIAALKAVKAEGVEVTLEHSTFVGTKSQNIPIIPVVNHG